MWNARVVGSCKRTVVSIVSQNASQIFFAVNIQSLVSTAVPPSTYWLRWFVFLQMRFHCELEFTALCDWFMIWRSATQLWMLVWLTTAVMAEPHWWGRISETALHLPLLCHWQVWRVDDQAAYYCQDDRLRVCLHASGTGVCMCGVFHNNWDLWNRAAFQNFLKMMWMRRAGVLHPHRVSVKDPHRVLCIWPQEPSPTKQERRTLDKQASRCNLHIKVRTNASPNKRLYGCICFQVLWW